MQKNGDPNAGNPCLVSLNLHEPMPVGVDQARVSFSPWKHREIVARWQLDWGRRERRPLMLGGPSGCGKKTLAFALANFMGRRVFWIDAQELDRPDRHPSTVSSSDPFDFTPRLVLVTHADAKNCGTVRNRTNRGAMQSLESRVPVIYVCADPFKESMKSLRQRCAVVTLAELEKSAMDEVAAFSMRCLNLNARLSGLGKPRWLVDQDVHRLVETSGGDARKLKHRLETYAEFGSLDFSGDAAHRSARELEKATSLSALADWMRSGSAGRSRERAEFLRRQASACRFLFEGPAALDPLPAAAQELEPDPRGTEAVAEPATAGEGRPDEKGKGEERKADPFFQEMSSRCRGQGASDTGFDVGKAPPSSLFNDVAILLRAPFLCNKLHITDEKDKKTHARALHRREARFLREDGSCGLVSLSPEEKVATDQFEYLWQLYPAACEQFAGENQVAFSRLTPEEAKSPAEFGRKSFLTGLWGAADLFSRIALVTADPDQRIKAGTAAGVLAARVGFAADPRGLIRQYLPFEKPVRESFSQWIKSRAAEVTLKDLWRNLCFADPDLGPFRNRTSVHLDFLPLLNRRVLGDLLPRKPEDSSDALAAEAAAKKHAKSSKRGATKAVAAASTGFFDLEGKEPWLDFVHAPERLDLTLWRGAWDRLSTSLGITTSDLKRFYASPEWGLANFVPVDRLRSAWDFNFDDAERKKENKKAADSAKLKKMTKTSRPAAKSTGARRPPASSPPSVATARPLPKKTERPVVVVVADEDPVGSLFQDIETLARGGTVSASSARPLVAQRQPPAGAIYDDASGCWIPPIVLKPAPRPPKRPTLPGAQERAPGDARSEKARPPKTAAPDARSGVVAIVDLGTVVDSDGRVIRKRRLV